MAACSLRALFESQKEMRESLEREVRESSLLENARRAVSVIIRPPRATYTLEGNDSDNEELPSTILASPMAFLNRRGQTIVGSLYVPSAFADTVDQACVLYLHGNIGSQREGRFLVDHLLPLGLSLFCFDFTGSGLSDGEFVGLGHHEREDTIDVMDLLHSQLGFAGFVLWGRSMGAATALLAAPHSPLIRGIIVDSAYTSLHELFMAVAVKVPIPALLRPLAVWWVKHEVSQRAHFDCDEVNPAASGRIAKVPLLLGHARDDEFLPFAQAETIFREYGGSDKEMMALMGGHNGGRSEEWIGKCIRFAIRVLGVDREVGVIGETHEKLEHAASFGELIERVE
jgi:pimeloyl-ACP methyl ester carboxylesterase